MKIAVCITTRNRPEAFKECLKNWKKFATPETQIFIVDDNSIPIYTKSNHYFNQRAGIPVAKNKCLELAYNYGAEHIFLSDDDCWPISHKAIPTYTKSSINHLAFSFQEPYGNTLERNQPITKGNYNIHQVPNGCMLYFKRICLETVGGFNTNFTPGTCEHIELTRRIFNAKLTPYPNMDVVNSNNLFFSLDQHNQIQRSFSNEERLSLIQKNNKLLKSKYRSKEFINFK